MTSALQKESEKELGAAQIGVNAQSDLYLKINNTIYYEKNFRATSGARIAEESAIESKIEVQSTIRKKCFEYLINKQKIGELTSNFE